MSDNRILTPFEWCLIGGTVVSTILCAIFLDGFSNAVSDFSWWFTSIAAVLNICCCCFSARGSRWTFLFGFIYNCMYTEYCFQTSHYGNAAVYGLIFLPLQVFGWLQWRKLGSRTEGEDVVDAKRLSWKWRAIVTVASAAVMAALAFLLKSIGGQDSLVDSMSTVLCVIAQLMLTFAFMEQWFIWIAVNVLTIAMWALSAWTGYRTEGVVNLSDLNLVICYIFVLVNSINGLLVWLRLSRKD